MYLYVPIYSYLSPLIHTYLHLSLCAQLIPTHPYLSLSSHSPYVSPFLPKYTHYPNVPHLSYISQLSIYIPHLFLCAPTSPYASPIISVHFHLSIFIPTDPYMSPLIHMCPAYPYIIAVGTQRNEGMNRNESGYIMGIYRGKWGCIRINGNT